MASNRSGRDCVRTRHQDTSLWCSWLGAASLSAICNPTSAFLNIPQSILLRMDMTARANDEIRRALLVKHYLSRSYHVVSQPTVLNSSVGIKASFLICCTGRIIYATRVRVCVCLSLCAEVFRVRKRSAVYFQLCSKSVCIRVCVIGLQLCENVC